MILRLLIIIACMALCGCTIQNEECFSAGAGTAVSENKLVIYAAYPSTWVNTGVFIDTNSKAKAEIFGSVNLCSSTANTQNVLVDGGQCADGSTPRYSSIPYPYAGILPLGCPNGWPAAGIEMIPVQTGINIKNGDILEVETIPYEIEITDCNNLPPGVLADVGMQYNKNSSGSQKMSFVDFCNNGGTIWVSGVEFKDQPPLKGQKFTIPIADMPGPQSNKYVNISNIPQEKYWFVGSMVDLRRLNTDKPDINSFDCSRAITDPRWRTLLSTEINKKCGTYCPNSNSPMGGPCTCTSFQRPGTTETKVIEGTSVQITSPAIGPDGNPLIFISQLTTCIGWLGGTSCKKSIEPTQTNSKLIISGLPDNNTYPISFALFDYNRYDNFGGFNLKVKRTCPRADGDMMYGYIGNDPYGLAPGSPGVFPIGRRTDHDNVFEFNVDNPPATGQLYLMIYTTEPSDGSYTVYTRHRTSPAIISAAVKWILDPLLNAFRGPLDANGVRSGGASRIIYNALLSPEMKKVIRVLISLYIALTFLYILMGIMPFSSKTMVLKILKISVVAVLLTDNSWDFFNKNLFSFFTTFSDALIPIFSSQYSGVGTGFEFLDDTLGILINDFNWKRILSLIFSGPIGWLYGLVILLAAWEIISAGVFAALLYLTCIIAVSILIATAPMFIAFFLLDYTRQFGDKWIRVLASYAMQPVFAFAVYGLGNSLLRVYIYQVFNFGVCQDCLIGMFLGGNVGTLCMVTWYYPMGFAYNQNIEERIDYEEVRDESIGENLFGLPVSASALLQLYILARGMKTFMHLAIEMSNGIFGTIYSTARSTTMTMTDDLKSIVGQDRESIQRRKRAPSRPKDAGSSRTGPEHQRDVGATRGGKADAVSGGVKDITKRAAERLAPDGTATQDGVSRGGADSSNKFDPGTASKSTSADEYATVPLPEKDYEAPERARVPLDAPDYKGAEPVPDYPGAKPESAVVPLDAPDYEAPEYARVKLDAPDYNDAPPEKSGGSEDDKK